MLHFPPSLLHIVISSRFISSPSILPTITIEELQEKHKLIRAVHEVVGSPSSKDREAHMTQLVCFYVYVVHLHVVVGRDIFCSWNTSAFVVVKLCLIGLLHLFISVANHLPQSLVLCFFTAGASEGRQRESYSCTDKNRWKGACVYSIFLWCLSF